METPQTPAVQLLTKVMGDGNLSQTQLARVLRVTPGAVNHWLTGRHNPSSSHLEALKRLQFVLEAKSKAFESGVDEGALKLPEEDSIALHAHRIVNERSEEKERQYGPFSQTMERATSIMRAITGLTMKTQDMYMALVALKLAREGHAHKRDNLLDAIAYLQALENYENEQHVH